jgi:hypothetical protein
MPRAQRQQCEQYQQYGYSEIPREMRQAGIHTASLVKHFDHFNVRRKFFQIPQQPALPDR